MNSFFRLFRWLSLSPVLKGVDLDPAGMPAGFLLGHDSASHNFKTTGHFSQNVASLGRWLEGHWEWRSSWWGRRLSGPRGLPFPEVTVLGKAVQEGNHLFVVALRSLCQMAEVSGGAEKLWAQDLIRRHMTTSSGSAERPGLKCCTPLAWAIDLLVERLSMMNDPSDERGIVAMAFNGRNQRLLVLRNLMELEVDFDAPQADGSLCVAGRLAKGLSGYPWFCAMFPEAMAVAQRYTLEKDMAKTPLPRPIRSRL